MLTERIKSLRTQAKLNQSDVAKMLGVTTSAYSMYERGEREIPNNYLVVLADKFNVTTDYLLGHETPDQPTDLKQIIRNQSMTFDGKPLSDRDVAVIESFLKTLKSE